MRLDCFGLLGPPEPTQVTEVPPPSISRELKRRWSHFIRKVYETDPLVGAKCSGEMRIISFIDQGAVIKMILQHLGLWEESHAPPNRGPRQKRSLLTLIIAS